MKCKVCGKRFVPVRTQIYQVRNEVSSMIAALTPPPPMQDAMDCPRCGCQHLLKERLQKVEGGNKE